MLTHGENQDQDRNKKLRTVQEAVYHEFYREMDQLIDRFENLSAQLPEKLKAAQLTAYSEVIVNHEIRFENVIREAANELDKKTASILSEFNNCGSEMATQLNFAIRDYRYTSRWSITILFMLVLGSSIGGGIVALKMQNLSQPTQATHLKN